VRHQRIMVHVSVIHMSCFTARLLQAFNACDHCVAYLPWVDLEAFQCLARWMGMLVTSVALEGLEWSQQFVIVGKPLCGLLDVEACDWITAACHTLVHGDGKNCWVFMHLGPRVNLAEASSVWLFSKEVSAKFYLQECHDSTELQVRQVFFMVLTPRVMVHDAIE
jgi:hypothetical protein